MVWWFNNKKNVLIDLPLDWLQMAVNSRMVEKIEKFVIFFWKIYFILNKVNLNNHKIIFTFIYYNIFFQHSHTFRSLFVFIHHLIRRKISIEFFFRFYLPWEFEGKEKNIKQIIITRLKRSVMQPSSIIQIMESNK